MISIHAPLAGCDDPDAGLVAQLAISIHAPLAGCDPSVRDHLPYTANFNPRTPCGVRQGERHAGGFISPISIHAPLAGCDLAIIFDYQLRFYFNPRTPCGVRLRDSLKLLPLPLFQSTHPLRGATANKSRFSSFISFQSTHPLRGATLMPVTCCSRLSISIHAPLAGCDLPYPRA